MLFIHPMWDNENQRLGFKACTPFGYSVHLVAESVGFIGLILFVAAPVYIVYRIFIHQFSWQLCWLLFVPIAVGVFGRVLWEISWRLATKKRFRYDSQTRTAKWGEGKDAHIFPKAQ
jgi:hypothetical protein